MMSQERHVGGLGGSQRCLHRDSRCDSCASARGERESNEIHRPAVSHTTVQGPVEVSLPDMLVSGRGRGRQDVGAVGSVGLLPREGRSVRAAATAYQIAEHPYAMSAVWLDLPTTSPLALQFAAPSTPGGLSILNVQCPSSLSLSSVPGQARTRGISLRNSPRASPFF